MLTRICPSAWVTEMFHMTIKSTQCHGINKGSLIIIPECLRRESLLRLLGSLFGILTCIQDPLGCYMLAKCEHRNAILHVQLQSRSAIWSKSKHTQYLTDLRTKEKYPISLLTMRTAFQVGFMPNHPALGGMKTRQIQAGSFQR